MLVRIMSQKTLDPAKLEGRDILKKLRNNLHARTYAAILRKVDAELDKLTPSRNSNLTWTKMAALFGYNADQNTKDNNYIWGHLVDVFGDDEDGKFVKMALGSLLQWRISLRKDIWVLWTEQTGATDQFTDKEITRSNYWIDNDFPI